jgi:multidrug efflux pump subunit AcrA (membrane-fusion protein)
MGSAVESAHLMSATLRRSRSDSRAETAYRERFPEFDTVPDDRVSPRAAPPAGRPSDGGRDRAPTRAAGTVMPRPAAQGTPRPVTRHRAPTVRGQTTAAPDPDDVMQPYRGEPRIRQTAPGRAEPRASSPGFDPQRTREIVPADRVSALRVRAPSPDRVDAHIVRSPLPPPRPALPPRTAPPPQRAAPPRPPTPATVEVSMDQPPLPPTVAATPAMPPPAPVAPPQPLPAQPPPPQPPPMMPPPAPRHEEAAPPAMPVAMGRPRVLVVDGDQGSAAWLHRQLGELFDIQWVPSAADATQILRHEPVPVMIVGEQVPDMPVDHLVELVTTRTRTTVITVSRTGAPAPSGVYYQLDRALDGEAIRQVVAGAFAVHRKPAGSAELTDAARIARLAGAARLVAMQRSAMDLARAVAAEAPALVDANRATCLFFDAEAGLLWSAHDPDEQAGIESPIAGLAGFAARTGAIAIVDRASDDPRYKAEVDNPTGKGDDRVAAVPIVDPSGEAHAVMMIVRDGRAAPFDGADRDLMIAFAARVAPVLDAFALEAKAESLSPPEPTPFRPEAVAAYKARKDEGAALQLAPRWAAIVFWVLIALVVIGVSYLCLARVNDYAEGPAVIIAEGQQPVTVRAPGTVSEVKVAVGDKVVAGQELVILYDGTEAADLSATELQFERALVERMQRPDDNGAATGLAQLVAQRDRARHGLAEKTIRAPVAGTIATVRLRPGQPVTAGQEALTIVSGDGGVTLLCFLPASYAPLMKNGLTIRLELDGHPRAYQRTKVSSFTTNASGPGAVSQFLGDQLGDTVQMPGAVVLVRGHMDETEFVADRKRLAYRHGMTGKVAVRVRSQRMILSFIPGLKEVFGYDYD